MSYLIVVTKNQIKTNINSIASNEHDALVDVVSNLNLVKIDLDSRIVFGIIKTFNTTHLKKILLAAEYHVKLIKFSEFGALI